MHTYGCCCYAAGVGQSSLKPLRRGGKLLHEEMMEDGFEVETDLVKCTGLGHSSLHQLLPALQGEPVLWSVATVGATVGILGGTNQILPEGERPLTPLDNA